MRCEYVFTLRDFEASLKPYRQVSKRAQIGYLTSVWIFPTLCILACAPLLYSFFYNTDQLNLPNLLLLSLMIGLAFGLPARYRLGVRRAFRQRNVLTQNRPMFFEFDEQNVRFIVPQGAEITYPWTSFTHFIEGNEVAVLFIGDVAFHTIPKRAMDEDGWANVRRLVQANLRKV